MLSTTTQTPDRAAEDLQFIRYVMERAVQFKAVPGGGMVLMGVFGAIIRRRHGG